MPRRQPGSGSAKPRFIAPSPTSPSAWASASPNVAGVEAAVVSDHPLASEAGRDVLAAGGKVDAPVGRHPVHRTRMAVVAGGKPADPAEVRRLFEGRQPDRQLLRSNGAEQLQDGVEVHADVEHGGVEERVEHVVRLVVGEHVLAATVDEESVHIEQSAVGVVLFVAAPLTACAAVTDGAAG